MASSSDSHKAGNSEPEIIVLLRDDEANYLREFPERCDGCQHLYLFHSGVYGGKNQRQWYCKIPFCKCGR